MTNEVIEFLQSDALHETLDAVIAKCQTGDGLDTVQCFRMWGLDLEDARSAERMIMEGVRK